MSTPAALARCGRPVSGAPIGILMLETRFPRILGDVGNAQTFDFPVLYKVVPGASPDRVVQRRAEGLLEPFLEASAELVAIGAEGIVGNCGFLSLFQKELAVHCGVPVATSSLMQAPLIERLLPPGRRVGILTIAGSSLTSEHLEAAGVAPDTPIVGTEAGREFSRVILNDEPEMDTVAAERDVLEAGAELAARHPEVGAVLLECTNMCPHAGALRRRLGLPVFDMVSFIDWFRAGLAPRAWCGPGQEAFDMPRLVAVVAIALVTGACAGERAMSGAPAASDLAGRIYDMRQDRFIEQEELVARLSWADFVLLGEQHDNAVHHQLQTRLVRALQARSRRPRALAFEMMGTDQQLAVALYLRDRPRDAAGLGEAVGWQASGWPDWRMYRPIAQAGLDAGAQIVAANLPRADVRAVFDEGLAALRTSVVERTGLDERLADPLATSLREELEAAHCGELSRDTVEGMFRVQRARDAVMADRLATASGAAGGILIAGAGHVRNDRGVPWYLRRLRPEASIASLAFLEAGDGMEAEPREPPFDFVWLTPAVDGEDPCARVERDHDRRPSRADVNLRAPAPQR